jgi:hypothetical protein
MSLAAQIESVQPDVFFKLASEPYFYPVTLLNIREKRLDTEVLNSLKGIGITSASANKNIRPGTKAGATIEVLFPTLLQPLEDTPGPVCTLQQKFLVKTQETINQGANGTGLSVEQIAVNLAQLFQLFFLGNSIQGFYASGDFYEYVILDRDQPFICVAVTLKATFSLAALARQVSPAYADVNIAGTDTVTLTDRQPGGGSAIFYTADGSFPGPGNPAAIPYSGPFTVPSGTIVRAAAYAQTRSPSGAPIFAGQGSSVTDYIST